MAEYPGNLCSSDKSWLDLASYLRRRLIKVKTLCPCNHFGLSIVHWSHEICEQIAGSAQLKHPFHMNWCLVPAVGTQPKFQTTQFMTYIPSLVYLWTMRSMKGRDVDDMLSQGTDYPFFSDHKISKTYGSMAKWLTPGAWLSEVQTLLVPAMESTSRIDISSAFGPCAFLSSFFQRPGQQWTLWGSYFTRASCIWDWELRPIGKFDFGFGCGAIRCDR